MFRADKKDAMYKEKLNDIIQELPFAIPTIQEIMNLTELPPQKATAYAKLNGVADPHGNSSYIVVGKNDEASYIDITEHCHVLDEKKREYSGLRPIIREDELSDDVKNILQRMRQVTDCHRLIPIFQKFKMKNRNQDGGVDPLKFMKSKLYKYEDRYDTLHLALECINLGTIPMELATRSEEAEFMAAKDNYDKGNSSSQFEKTSRVFSENLGLGKLKVTDPVYLFKGQEFILTRTDRLPHNLNYAYIRSGDNDEVLIEHSSDTMNRKIFGEKYSAGKKVVVESRNVNKWKQALLKVQPVTWIYDPRVRAYICEQIIASARDIPLDNFQLPKDFAKQFVKHM